MRAAAAVAIALCAQLATARADDNKARADALYEKANAQFKAGHYQEAVRDFRAAYDLVRDPVYLFNLAQAYRKLLDCLKADDNYRRFLADATDIDAATRTKVEQWLSELAPCVEQRKRESDAARRYEEAEKQRKAEVAAEERRRAAQDQGRGLRRVGLVVAGVGAGLLVTGGVFALRGSSIKNELADACASGCEWTPELEDRERAGRLSNVLAITGGVVGASALIGGLLSYAHGRAERSRALTIAPTGKGAVVWFRF